MGNHPLSDRQEQFCLEYLIDLCAKSAAERAGYAPANAAQQGYRLLKDPRIAARVKVLKARRAEQTLVDAESVVRELAVIGFSRLTPFLRYDDDGTLHDITLDGASPEQLAGLVSVTVDKRIERTGKGENATEAEITRTRIALGNKGAALRDLGNHLGIFKGKDDDVMDRLRDILAGKPLPPDAFGL